ncbi:predicted protein [Histoplasma capsulatum H143]|uniref:Uncharacterized protein n=1 Tax=Ajellomyces capsulatus (strain H143) TaxID=544712 RepID=C6HP86_AJECH|nr:predicted protein [Histoplasma capsulatum H143]
MVDWAGDLFAADSSGAAVWEGQSRVCLIREGRARSKRPRMAASRRGQSLGQSLGWWTLGLTSGRMWRRAVCLVRDMAETPKIAGLGCPARSKPWNDPWIRVVDDHIYLSRWMHSGCLDVWRDLPIYLSCSVPTWQRREGKAKHIDLAVNPLHGPTEPAEDLVFCS